MSITDKMTALTTEASEIRDAITARAKLQNFANVVAETNAAVQIIVDGGTFDTIDDELKVVLNQVFAISKDAATSLDTNDINELFNWRV